MHFSLHADMLQLSYWDTVQMESLPHAVYMNYPGEIASGHRLDLPRIDGDMINLIHFIGKGYLSIKLIDWQ